MSAENTNKKIYLKDKSSDPIYKTVNFPFFFKTRILSGLLMALGFIVLGTQVVLPLIFFKTQDKVIKPMEQTVLGVATGFKNFDFQEIKENTKYIEKKDSISEYFYITIPKLKINNALVKSEFDGPSPDDFLGHYKGSALPGETGNTFIYGHSVLPWFFNPKNYKTIFSTLGDLEEGDRFSINYNGKELVYEVKEKNVLPPNEVNPLEIWRPKYLNESTVTLMTCWPAGTKTKRLLVKAILLE
ncbi:MAG TPA: sortase [bacterium]|jgi:LPXTG-site transpeptidase (sortase) family protein|nr:sortase [bacterium]